MDENISAADILAEYVSDEGLVTEWPHGSKQDAESVVKFAELLKAENAALQEKFTQQMFEIWELKALRERVAELEAEIAELKQDRTTGAGYQTFTVAR